MQKPDINRTQTNHLYKRSLFSMQTMECMKAGLGSLHVLPRNWGGHENQIIFQLYNQLFETQSLDFHKFLVLQNQFVLGLSTAFHFHPVQLFLSVSLSARLFVSEQNRHFFSTSILIFPMIFSLVFVHTPLGQYHVSKRFQERHWGLSKGRTLISTLLLELVKWQESPSLDPTTSRVFYWVVFVVMVVDVSESRMTP